MGKIIYQTKILKCEPEKAFEMFTINENLEKWLTEKAEVESYLGGKYELFWNPEDRENDSTIGCRILALHRNTLISFEWKGPKQFKHFMNDAKPLTNVAVLFRPHQQGTELHLLHSGWKDTGEWEEARMWFDRAWKDSLGKLESLINDPSSA